MANSCFGICCKSITVLEDQHQHPLQLIRNSRTPYKCDGCKEIGLGSSYRCGERNCPGYQLHRECKDLASAGSTTTHSLFSDKVQFKFEKQSPEHVGSCVACGKDVQGFRYQLSPRKIEFGLGLLLRSKALVLHPCCFKLPSNRTDEGVNLELKEKAPSKCQICQSEKISKKIQGWAYVSTNGEYCYHVKCVKELVDNKNFHQQSDGTNTTTLQLEIKQKAFKVSKQMMKQILMLIISAILGDAVSLIIDLVL